jgi:hypothetical protein
MRKTAPLLIIAAVISGVLLLELSYQVLLFSRSVNNVSGMQRIIFVNGRDTIFQNRDDIFT